MDGKERVEEVGQPDALCFRDQPKEGRVSVKAPGLSLGGDLKCRLAITVEEFVPERSGGILVREFDGDGSDPLDVNDGDEAVGQNTLHCRAARQFLQPCHERSPHSAYESEDVMMMGISGRFKVSRMALTPDRRRRVSPPRAECTR